MEGVIDVLTVKELVRKYIERQDAFASATLDRMRAIEDVRDVHGWMLLECHQLDSSHMGEYTLLPYGPGCTFREVPSHPVSPRGLASDMSVVVAISKERVREGVKS